MIPGRILAISVFAAWMAACGGGATTHAKKEPDVLEPVSGRKAFYRMYITARAWAADAEALECASLPIQAAPPAEGAYAAWRCVFVSPSKGLRKPYTYSLVGVEPNIHQGMFGGTEDRYDGPTANSTPFSAEAFSVDSTDVYKTVMESSQARGYARKNPEMPMMFQLEKTGRFPNVVWRVFWGARAGFSDLTVYVDAATGKRLEIEG